MLNVSVKKLFLTKFSDMSLEDLDTKDNFCHRLHLPGWLIISAEGKILYCFSPTSKCFPDLKNGLREYINTLETKAKSCVHL